MAQIAKKHKNLQNLLKYPKVIPLPALLCAPATEGRGRGGRGEEGGEAGEVAGGRRRRRANTELRTGAG